MTKALSKTSSKKIGEIEIVLHIDSLGNIVSESINHLAELLEKFCFSTLRNREETKRSALCRTASGISKQNKSKTLSPGQYHGHVRIFADFARLEFRAEIYLLVEPDESSISIGDCPMISIENELFFEPEEYRLLMIVFSFSAATVAALEKERFHANHDSDPGCRQKPSHYADALRHVAA